jgi:hypothetical protein
MRQVTGSAVGVGRADFARPRPRAQKSEPMRTDLSSLTPSKMKIDIHRQVTANER